jgi:hypothetical protein
MSKLLQKRVMDERIVLAIELNWLNWICSAMDWTSIRVLSLEYICVRREPVGSSRIELGRKANTFSARYCSQDIPSVLEIHTCSIVMLTERMKVSWEALCERQY